MNQITQALEALHAIKATLVRENEAEHGPICDTIWHSDCETLFDFIDNTIEHLSSAAPSAAEPVVRNLIDKSRLVTAFCSKWSGYQQVKAGEALDWIMSQPLAAPAATVNVGGVMLPVNTGRIGSSAAPSAAEPVALEAEYADAVKKLAADKGMSEEQILRAAIRLYQSESMGLVSVVNQRAGVGSSPTSTGGVAPVAGEKTVDSLPAHYEAMVRFLLKQQWSCDQSFDGAAVWRVEFVSPYGEHESEDDPVEALRLAAPPAPQAASEPASVAGLSGDAEREAFEAWFVVEGDPGFLVRRPAAPDEYVEPDVQASWEAWQARAALHSTGKPDQDDIGRRLYSAEGQVSRLTAELASARGCINEWIEYGGKITDALGLKVMSPKAHIQEIARLRAAPADAPVAEPVAFTGVRPLPETMTRDEMLKHYTAHANLLAHEALQYQKQIRDLQQQLAANSPVPDEAKDAARLDALSRPGWELGMSDDPEVAPWQLWQVHRCSGGRNDREWTLLGAGATPREAIDAALSQGGGA